MNASSFVSWSIDQLTDAPPALILMIRWTLAAVGGLGGLRGDSRAATRWRRRPWRATAVGVVAIAGFRAMPPVITWRIAPVDRAPS